VCSPQRQGAQPILAVGPAASCLPKWLLIVATRSAGGATDISPRALSPAAPEGAAECIVIPFASPGGWFLIKYHKPWADAQSYTLPRLRHFIRLRYY